MVGGTGLVLGARSVVAQASGDEGELVLLVPMALLGLLGAYAVWRGASMLGQGYRIGSNDPIPVERARIADGVVEIEGTAHPLSETIESQYTDTECLAHEWKKQRQRTREGPEGNERTTWRTTDEGSEAVPFLVRDESGEIAVDPEGATLSLSADATRKRHDIQRTESRLEVGDEVHVYGQHRSVTEPREGLGDETVYVGDGDDVSTLRISDSSATGSASRLIAKGAVILLVGGLLAAVSGISVALFLGLV